MSWFTSDKLASKSNGTIIKFPLYYLSSGRLREVKSKNKFKFLAPKLVAVAYERSFLIRGFKHIDFRTYWYFAKLVAEGRWSLTRGDRNLPTVKQSVKSGTLFLQMSLF